jgi:DNA modification methylase
MIPKSNENKLRISSLSYLQSKIIEEIYLSLDNGQQISKKKIANKIHYNEESKIFDNAINTLLKKGAIKGNFKNGFLIPKKLNYLLEIIKTKNLKKKTQYNNLIVSTKLKQREMFEEFDFNKLINEIDKWYSYIEEFSSDLILKKINDEKLKKNSIIFDPFIGSGTTAIISNLVGHDAIGFDSNPLMTMVSKVKTNWTIKIKKIEDEFKTINKKFLREINDNKKIEFKNYFSNMPDKEIDQWLSLKNKKEIATLKKIINNINDKEIKEFFLICMAKSAFDTSYVALCPGTTFYPFREKKEFWNEFGSKVFNKIKQLNLINKNLNFGTSKFYNDNCINVCNHLKNNSVDFAITSPPYPNDLEYTRQTRLELYLLDFVKSMEDVAKIKKQMVKSSTKLIFKESDSSKFIDEFSSIEKISKKIAIKLKDKSWGWDYPRMVKEYFGDMYLCLRETKKILKKDAKFILVCGDQTIQGVFIPVCDILLEIAKKLGYSETKKEKYRIRRSTGHNIPLPEDLVILKK